MKPFKKAHRITEDKRKNQRFPQISFLSACGHGQAGGNFFYPQNVG